MPTRRSADSTDGERLFETAVQQFDAAADLIGLADNIRQILRSPKNAQRLSEGISQLEKGQGVVKSLDELS